MAVADAPFTEEQRAWLEKMIPPQPTTQTMGRAATLGDPPIPPRPSSTPLGECWTRIGRCIYASAGDLSKVTSARHVQRRRTAPRPLTLRPRSGNTAARPPHGTPRTTAAHRATAAHPPYIPVAATWPPDLRHAQWRRTAPRPLVLRSDAWQRGQPSSRPSGKHCTATPERGSASHSPAMGTRAIYILS